jgi:hypothetical protein
MTGRQKMARDQGGHRCSCMARVPGALVFIVAAAASPAT